MSHRCFGVKYQNLTDTLQKMERQPFFDVESLIFGDSANGKLLDVHPSGTLHKCGYLPTPPMQRRVRSALTAIRTGFLGPEG